MKTLRAFGHSFRFAARGFGYVVKTERNMKFHVCASIAVTVLAYVCKVSKVETLFLASAIAFVFFAECMNTAVERTVDLTVRERHPLGAIAKDAAASAVLVASVYALLIFIIVFGPHGWELLHTS